MGQNTATTYRLILSDNKSTTVPGDTAERFATVFVDDFTGWKQLTFPWEVFYRDGYQPGGGDTPNDGLTLTEMWAYAISPVSGSGVFYIDQVKLIKTTGALVNDFQAGVPADWFTYADWGGGASIGASGYVTTTLLQPGAVENTVLKVTYTIAGWGAGAGRDLAPDDWSAYDGLSFWFYGQNTATTYRLILSDNKSTTVPGDTAERFATVFVDDFTGWKQLTFPWEVFYRDGYQPGGGDTPNDGLTLTEMWAYAISPVSGSGVFYIDQVKLIKTTGALVNDFQAGVPAGWFTYADWGGGASIGVSGYVTTTLLQPGAVENTVLKVTYTIAGWGAGAGRDLAPDDWSAYDGLSFWFYGQNTATTYRLILSDNKSETVPGDTAERFATTFVDDFTGWKMLTFPWEVFYRDGYQPGGGDTPNDGLTLTEMWAYAISPVSGSGVFYLDQVKTFDYGAQQTLTVAFEQSIYSVTEGDTASITVTLSMASTDPVTVTYATSDGTASSTDYNSAGGQMVFAPGVISASFRSLPPKIRRWKIPKRSTLPSATR